MFVLANDFFSHLVTATDNIDAVFGVSDFNTLEVVVNSRSVVVNFYSFYTGRTVGVEFEDCSCVPSSTLAAWRSNYASNPLTVTVAPSSDNICIADALNIVISINIIVFLIFLSVSYS